MALHSEAGFRRPRGYSDSICGIMKSDAGCMIPACQSHSLQARLTNDNLTVAPPEDVCLNSLNMYMYMYKYLYVKLSLIPSTLCQCVVPFVSWRMKARSQFSDSQYTKTRFVLRVTKHHPKVVTRVQYIRTVTSVAHISSLIIKLPRR